MGIGPKFSEGNTTPPNPDPIRYKVLESEQIGDWMIAEVLYAGCTTFEGRKLLLLRRPLKVGTLRLDPHLLGLGHIVMARFEPNEMGWALARLCCIAHC